MNNDYNTLEDYWILIAMKIFLECYQLLNENYMQKIYWIIVLWLKFNL